MQNRIRFVIWEPRRLFWSKPAASAGERRSPAHEVVIALAERGIPSALLLRPDQAALEQRLTAQGLWPYFVFSTFDVTAKIPRIEQILKSTRLAPRAVLYLGNTAAECSNVKRKLPELEVADIADARTLLADPTLQGSPDPDCSQLRLYQTIQRARTAQSQFPNRGAFLRQSQLQLSIDYNVVAPLDQVIDLLQGPNLLHYTRKELPDDREEAKQALIQQLAGHDVHAGLVRLRSGHGDYGIVGFFLEKAGFQGNHFEHFCFSPHVAGMGIETWLHSRLGRRSLARRNTQQRNALRAKSPNWIVSAGAAADHPALAGVSEVVAAGSCELTTMMRYCVAAGATARVHFPLLRHGARILRNHALCLYYGLVGMTDAQRAEAHRLGYEDSDFRTPLATKMGKSPVWLLSFWADPGTRLFRHRETGLTLPVALRFLPMGSNDLTLANKDLLDGPTQTRWGRDIVDHIVRHYDCLGRITAAQFRVVMDALMARASSGTRIFVVPSIEKDAAGATLDWKAAGNAMLREVLAAYPAVQLLDLAAYARAGELDPENFNHYHSAVYHRAFMGLMQHLENRPVLSAAA